MYFSVLRHLLLNFMEHFLWKIGKVSFHNDNTVILDGKMCSVVCVLIVLPCCCLYAMNSCSLIELFLFFTCTRPGTTHH